MVEGIYFIKHLVRNGIMQGFFFELYDLSENQILAYKEAHRDKSIHPIVIKTNMVFPSSQLMLFRYTLNGRTSYLLAKRMVIHFSPEECNSKISGKLLIIWHYATRNSQYDNIRLLHFLNMPNIIVQIIDFLPLLRLAEHNARKWMNTK